MAKISLREYSTPVDYLLQQIEQEEYILPQFQRGFVWNERQIKEYFESLYKGYPTGMLLIWEQNTKKRKDAKLILDGQQRVTTLYSFIKGKSPKWYKGEGIRLDLYFNLQDETFQYYMITIMQEKKEWVSVSGLFQQGTINYIQQFPAENQMYYFSKENIKKLQKLESIVKYQYHVQEIQIQNNPENQEKKMDDMDEMVDLFNKVNSTGTRLSKGDLALAVVSVHWEDCKKSMEEMIKLYGTKGFHFDMLFFVRCISVVATSQGTFNKIGDLGEKELIEAWEKVKKSLEYWIDILFHHGYIDENFLSSAFPFFPVIYYLSRNNFKIPDEQTRNKFLFWFYLSLMWSRYSASSESVLHHDVQILEKYNSVDELIKSLKLSRGGNLLLSEEDLEFQGSRSAFWQMIYILIRSNGTKDWKDPSISLYPKSASNSYTMESYFLFPKKKLYKEFLDSSSSYDKKIANELANIVFLPSTTNTSLFKKNPEEYLPSVAPLQRKLQYIPDNPDLWEMTQSSYLAFLKERRQLLVRGINQFLHNLYQDTTEYIPSQSYIDQLRDKVEAVEKAIRDLIFITINQKIQDIPVEEWIPDGILNQAQSRIRQYLEQHPYEKKEEFSSLEKQITFFNVSDYCTVICKEENWQSFKGFFGKKELVQNRFNQFKTLRNALAHNHIEELTPVVIKDGEASILWFSSAIASSEDKENS